MRGSEEVLMLISNPLKKRTLNLRGAVILVSLLSISTVLAQTQDTETSTKPGPVETQTSNDTEKRGEFLIAPIPINSPAIGAGLEWAVAYVFPFNKQDKIPPPHSVFGIGGLFGCTLTMGVGEAF
jgi:hypothetical protein